jgi:hypothetical protein
MEAYDTCGRVGNALNAVSQFYPQSYAASYSCNITQPIKYKLGTVAVLCLKNKTIHEQKYNSSIERGQAPCEKKKKKSTLLLMALSHLDIFFNGCMVSVHMTSRSFFLSLKIQQIVVLTIL